MAGINLTSPTAYTTGFLIADTITIPGGSNDAISQMTKVGGVTVNAALEVQSTQGALLFPRLTSTQIGALTTVCNGMGLYNSTINGFQFYSNGAWSAAAQNSNSVALTSANITGMYATPVSVLAAPGAGLAYLITGFSINYTEVTAAYTGGGNISLQYGNTAHAGAGVITNTIGASAFTSATNTLSYATGAGTVVTGTQAYVNTAVYISNASAAFATGSGTATLTIYYTIVSAV